MDIVPAPPVVDLRRYREVGAPRSEVWDWFLSRPEELMALDPLHARIEPVGLPLRRGSRVLIHHEFPLGYREDRVAQVTVLRPFVIGFGERVVSGTDWFPHSYRFSLAGLDDRTCVVGFHLRGRFRMPGARWWWLPWFTRLAPARIDQALVRLEAALLRRDHGMDESSPAD